MFSQAVRMRDWIESTLKEKLDLNFIQVRDLNGGDDHFEAIIVSPVFEGKSMVLQHQTVYRALGEAMKERIHALTLKTMTPDQWSSQKNSYQH